MKPTNEPSFTVPDLTLQSNNGPGGVKPVTPQPGENVEAVGQVRAGEIQEPFAQLGILQAYTARIVAKTGDTSITPVSIDMPQHGAEIDAAMAAKRAATNADAKRNAA